MFLSAFPATWQEGATGTDVLAVTVPDKLDLGNFAIIEEGHDAWEWVVPAALLNETAAVRLLSEDEVRDPVAGVGRSPQGVRNRSANSQHYR